MGDPYLLLINPKPEHVYTLMSNWLAVEHIPILFLLAGNKARLASLAS